MRQASSLRLSYDSDTIRRKSRTLRPCPCNECVSQVAIDCTGLLRQSRAEHPLPCHSTKPTAGAAFVVRCHPWPSTRNAPAASRALPSHCLLPTGTIAIIQMLLPSYQGSCKSSICYRQRLYLLQADALGNKDWHPAIHVQGQSICYRSTAFIPWRPLLCRCRAPWPGCAELAA